MKFDTEIRFIGIKRGGQHGVINWLRAQRPLCDSHRYCNNLKVDHDAKRPFKGAVDAVLDCGCRNLFHTWEDLDLSLLREKTLDESPAKRLHYVLLIRDPFNLFASRLRWKVRNGISKAAVLNEKNVDRLIALWKQHAREYLGLTDILPHKIVVTFNRWFTDRNYRRVVSSLVGLEFSDAALNRVSANGYGSSFDGSDHDGSAQQSKVLERYKEVVDEPLYKTVCEDKELCELSHAIFGNVRS